MTFLDTAVTSDSGVFEFPATSKRPSARAARFEAAESTLCLKALDSVTESRNDLLGSVFGTTKFERLPRYRQQFIKGYARGVADGLAKRQGKPVSFTPPPDNRIPVSIQCLQPNATWGRHPYGNGWVSSTAYVSLTAYVGPGAAVFDTARVTGHARIYGGARVCESAEIYDGAQAHGRAVVAGKAQVGGSAKVFGDTLLIDGIYLHGVVR